MDGAEPLALACRASWHFFGSWLGSENFANLNRLGPNQAQAIWPTMGQCAGKTFYVAKETYHPFANQWEGFSPDTRQFHQLQLEGCPPGSGPPPAAKVKASNQRLALLNRYSAEKPLRMDCGHRLKMQQVDTGLVGPDGSELYLMKNLQTKQTGLVPKDLVAKEGTIECEP